MIDAVSSGLVARIRARLGERVAQVLDAEDVLQESLAAAVRSLGEEWTGSRAELRRYVLSIAERRILNEARRLRVRRHDALDETPPDESDGVDPTRRAGDRDKRVSSHSGRLQPMHQWVLLLRRLGARWDTVAVVMDRRTVAAAKMLHHRARSTLAERVRFGA